MFILPVLGLLATSRLVAHPVLEWNGLLLDAIRVDTSPPTLATRNLAIFHLSIHDAVNSVTGLYQPYRWQMVPAGETDPAAAAVGAAYTAALLLYPQQRALFDGAYANFLAETPATMARSNGLALGRQVALWTVDGRSADGANTQVPYIPSDAPGQWRRTPPYFRPPTDPHWRYVDPFCLTELEPFVPPPPPALESPEYAADLSLVQELGGSTSATRTPEQTLIAAFWSDFSYTATPAGHWQEIAAAIVDSREVRLPEAARLFALLSLAQADAAIVAWEAKYRYNFWRPVTAIQRASEDNNPATEPDPAWASRLPSPPFPEYVSGHSTFSGASATVLAGHFGTDHLPFTVGADAVPGVFRRFDSVWACAEEVGMSRIYGGIHFPSANREGKECGRRIALRVLRDFLLPNDRLPHLFWEPTLDTPGLLRVHGRLGYRVVVEESMDLQNWAMAAAQDAVPGGFTIEIKPSAGSCFYRARQE